MQRALEVSRPPSGGEQQPGRPPWVGPFERAQGGLEHPRVRRASGAVDIEEQQPVKPGRDRVAVRIACERRRPGVLSLGQAGGLGPERNQRHRLAVVAQRAVEADPYRRAASGDRRGAEEEPAAGQHGEWEQADGVALPEGGDRTLERIWVIARGEADGTLYAGGDPGVLFESHDGGASWEINAGLWEQPSHPHWQPGGGGLCLHSICTWPGDPDKLAVAVSAVGLADARRPLPKRPRLSPTVCLPE